MSLFDNNFDTGAITAAACVIVVASVIGYFWASTHQTDRMSKDIQLALEKGIDPMVIRCAYANEDDRVCLVHAAANSKHNNPSSVTLKK